MKISESTVLVVDDMLSMRLMIKAILREIGIERLLEAGDGERAAELLKSDRIDLVVCDWDMPKMTGLGLLQHVRAEQAMKHLPFVMLTANSNREHVTQAIESGVSDYLAKPFRPEDLVAKLEKVWQNHERAQMRRSLN